ncbi:MAG TPA: YidB family protein [Steroidobacteraceae bacterium]|nr:YidB family protein [Steroidobacteraceae bacterium]
MGLLDGILGGIVGAEATHLISGVIEQHGGLSGLATQFQKQGLGGVMQSWIGTGANSPISAEQIQQVLGSNTVTQLAAKLGLNPQDVAQKLAQMLPTAVDKMTPAGVLPTR